MGLCSIFKTEGTIGVSMLVMCVQFESQRKDLTKKQEKLNKEKTTLLLEVGKLEQEAEVSLTAESAWF